MGWLSTPHHGVVLPIHTASTYASDPANYGKPYAYGYEIQGGFSRYSLVDWRVLNHVKRELCVGRCWLEPNMHRHGYVR